ncbi:MAG: type II secretion system protein GspC [Gammaproteobacteria bacterium]|nr:type II secretion system protein GspC [Gammaproteobacteria bacterium]MDE2461215.1 type II secretion system protein GspC [Gammaproteobacteria bacterium]
MELNNLHMTDANAMLHRWWPALERRLPLWVSMLLGILIAWSLAELTWALLPGPKSAAPIYKAPAAAPAFNPDSVAGLHLFGIANSNAGANAPETTLNLTLRGLAAATPDAKQSLAIIASNGVAQMYAVGAQLPGGALLQSIYPDHVLLNLNGHLQSLSLPKSSSSAGDDDAGLAGPAIPRVVYGSNLPATQNLNQLRNELVSHPERLLDMMRAMPVMENGKLSGYRVFPVGNSNAFGKLGLEPGDVVTAVNGIPLDNPAQSLQVLNNIRTSEQVSITFTRNGQQQTKILQLQNSGNSPR